jgi:putative nucleotidyltransferase with HDIG domain
MPPRLITELTEAIRTSIPTDTGIIGSVIQVLYNPATSATELAQVFECDPPLTAKLLKAANSAFYGTSTSINSLRRAVVTLGFDTIKELVATVTMSQFFIESDNKGGLDRRGLWIHSVAVARTAQFISTHYGSGRPDVAYTVGLLHDIGKIVLTILFPVQYDRVVALAAEKGCRIILAERRVLNADHCIVGRVLCEAWNLPGDIKNAVSFHNDPLDSSGDDYQLIRLIHLSDIMARIAGIGNPGDAVVPTPSPAALSLLGPTPEKIQANYEEVLADLEAAKSEIEGFFSNPGNAPESPPASPQG